MLQRVSFAVAGTDVVGILHLPDGETLGGAAVLPSRSGSGAHGEFLCTALAAGGVAALRYDSRVPGDVAAGLADAAGAIRLLRAHHTVPQRVAVAGHSYAGAVAALVAGRDSRIRAAALFVPPAEREYLGAFKPMAELSRTRARVLLVGASADDVVPPGDVERYAALLRGAGVTHRVVVVDGADHEFSRSEHRGAMLAAVTAWMRESLGG